MKNKPKDNHYIFCQTINKVILVGNIATTPKIKYSPPHDSEAYLSIATSEWWTDKKTGHKQEKTEWHKIKVLGKLAEKIYKYYYQGFKIYIEGSLQTNTSDNTVEIIVNSPNGVIERIDPPYIDYVDPDTAYINNMANFDTDPL